MAKISISEFARRCGVARTTVLRSKKLQPYISNNIIDTSKGPVKTYLAEKKAGKKQGSDQNKTNSPHSSHTSHTFDTDEEFPDIDPMDALPEDIRKLADWPLRKLVYHFGTDERFKYWLDGAQKIESLAEKKLKNKIAIGESIDREYVRHHLVGLFEVAFSRLVTDTPKSIATQVKEAIEAGQELPEIEELVRDLIGQQLSGIKEKLVKAIKRGKR